MKKCIVSEFCIIDFFTFHLSPWFSPSAVECSPPSMPSVVFCLLLSFSRWFPPSLLCRLAIFCLVVPLISSLSLVATLCSVQSIYCPPFFIPPVHVQSCFSVYSITLTIFVLCLISEHGTLSCSFKLNNMGGNGGGGGRGGGIKRPFATQDGSWKAPGWRVPLSYLSVFPCPAGKVTVLVSPLIIALR